MPLYHCTYKNEDDGSKSIVKVVTPDSELYGRTVTLTDGNSSLTSTFSNAGVCTFIDVELIGTLTVSATTSSGSSVSDTFNMPYYGEIIITLELSKIYGVYWDGSSSPAMTRTDAAANFSDPIPQMSNGSGGWTTGSSPFDTISPWKDMVIVDDDTAGKLVKIPKYYYKWTKSGSTMTLQISMEQFNGSYVSPAHADRGDGKGERDVVYIGRYHCASTTYKSTSGVTPAGKITRANFRTKIHNLGSIYWQNDFAMWWTIRMLYLVEFANWDSQVKIGYGRGAGSGVVTNGYTDPMPYHTGTIQTSRTTYGVGTQYRHIESLWDNAYDWCDGIYFSGSNVYIINNPINFSDSANGTYIGTRATTSGYIKSWFIPSASGFKWALFPLTVDSTTEAYVCDTCEYNSSGTVARSGGDAHQSTSDGLFYLGGHKTDSYTSSRTCSRLMKLP